MAARLSELAKGLTVETAFQVLARARELASQGKEVVELEIGDSPFDATSKAREAAIEAINAGKTHYCPSDGIPEFKKAIADTHNKKYGLSLGPENVVVGPGAKIFEQLFCEALVNPDEAVLIFNPYFPTYVPNIMRRGARTVFTPLLEKNDFRPDFAHMQKVLDEEPKLTAVFLNSPHNPTGGVLTKSDLEALAQMADEHDLYLLSDEPYVDMVWQGEHRSIIQEAGMLERSVAAYTMSKSFSMSGFRLGYSLTSPEIAEVLGKLINTNLSCTAPFAQEGGRAALLYDGEESQSQMSQFKRKVEILATGLNEIPEVSVKVPRATFYVFANFKEVCNRLKMVSHGLALFLLEAADDKFGVACLGGECFGTEGYGFLRFSCAQPDEKMLQAVEFISQAIKREERASSYLEAHPDFALKEPYAM